MYSLLVPLLTNCSQYSHFLILMHCAHLTALTAQLTRKCGAQPCQWEHFRVPPLYQWVLIVNNHDSVVRWPKREHYYCEQLPITKRSSRAVQTETISNCEVKWTELWATEPKCSLPEEYPFVHLTDFQLTWHTLRLHQSTALSTDTTQQLSCDIYHLLVNTTVKCIFVQRHKNTSNKMYRMMEKTVYCSSRALWL